MTLLNYLVRILWCLIGCCFSKMFIKVTVLEQYFGDPNDSQFNGNKILVSKDDSVSLKQSIELNCLSFIY